MSDTTCPLVRGPCLKQECAWWVRKVSTPRYDTSTQTIPATFRSMCAVIYLAKKGESDEYE